MTETHKVCDNCHADEIISCPIIHHYLCAYIGPSYDFLKTDTGYQCPKCKCNLQKDEGSDWENVGQVKKCQSCGTETLV